MFRFTLEDWFASNLRDDAMVECLGEEEEGSEKSKIGSALRKRMGRKEELTRMEREKMKL